MIQDDPNQRAKVVTTELDRQLEFLSQSLKEQRGETRRKITDWSETVRQVRDAADSGYLDEETVQAFTRQGCLLTGAIPANQAGPYGEAQVWVTSSEEMSQAVHDVHQLADLIRTAIPAPGDPP